MNNNHQARAAQPARASQAKTTASAVNARPAGNSGAASVATPGAAEAPATTASAPAEAPATAAAAPATAAARSPQRVVEPDAGPARYLLEQNDRRIGERRDAQIAAIGIGPENAETEISFIVFHRSNGCEEFDLFRVGIVRAGIVVPVSRKGNTMVSSIVSEANDFQD